MPSRTSGYAQRAWRNQQDRFAAVFGRRALTRGEISEITLAMTNKIGLGKIANTIHPYPAQAEATRKLEDQFNRTKLTPLSIKVLGVLRKLNVGRK